MRFPVQARVPRYRVLASCDHLKVDMSTMSSEHSRESGQSSKLDTTLLKRDIDVYDSDAHSIASSRSRRTNRRKPAKYANDTFTAAARAQLSRDRKKVKELRLLGEQLPDTLVYVDAPHGERRKCAQQKVDSRPPRRSYPLERIDGAPLATRARLTAGAVECNVVTTGTDGDALNKQVEQASTTARIAPLSRPRRAVPLVAAGVHLRKIHTTQARYATPITENTADSQIKGERKWFSLTLCTHVQMDFVRTVAVQNCGRCPLLNSRPNSLCTTWRRLLAKRCRRC